jgi:hypothetical protein
VSTPAHPPTRDEAAAGPTVLQPTDVGLRCPGCDYNLTGIAEERCPECGRPFDRKALLAILAGGPAPIPIWDDPERPAVLRFIQVCLATWFRPGRVARDFPVRPAKDSVRRFGRLCLGTAVVIVLFLLAADPTNPAHIRSRIASLAAILFGIPVCEMLLAAFVSPDSTRASSWCGLVTFLRSFVILDAIWLAGVAATSHLSPGLESLDMLGLLFVGTWWWIALVSVAAARGGHEPHWATVLGGVPIVVVMSGFAAMLAGTLMMLLVTRFD